MGHLNINPVKCLGCSACALICSATWHKEFNPAKAFVQIKKHDHDGLFTISFSSLCKQCMMCGKECPTGALSVTETEGGES